jgi:anti-sigma regulatory factor (Ser/Thr protein kinase)
MSRMADSESEDRGSDGRNPDNGSARGRAREVPKPQGRADAPGGAACRSERQASAHGHPPLLDQQFDGGSLDLLRAAVAAHAAAAGLSIGRARDAVLAAHELAANAVRHGAGHGRIRQWADGHLLYCQVSDPGPANRIAAGPGDKKPWLAEYGHGLWLARQVADHMTMGHGPGGTDVAITFAIDSA